MDSAGRRRRQRRRAELARAREQLVLPLQRRRDDVEEDVRSPHGLHEDVLGPGGDATQGGRGVTSAGVQSTEMNYVYMIRGGTTITCYHSRWKIEKDKGGCVVRYVQKERDTQSSA